MMAEASLAGLPQADEEIDTRGLNCPLPILRTKKALARLTSGQILVVLTTDPHAVRDFQAFCQQTGNGLLAQETRTEGVVAHYVQRR
jgi:tRNA 2-thiouridine synthesizing protein A